MDTDIQRKNDGVSGAVISTIEKELQTNHHAFFQTVGFSMEPMLHQRKSTVVLKAPEDPAALSVGDVVLFHREDDHYVLHRIVRIGEKDGSPLYVIRGDNCLYDDLVRPEQILGVMEGFFADERNVYVPADDQTYQSYVKRILKRNLLWLRIKSLPGRVLRKIYRTVFKRNTKQ